MPKPVRAAAALALLGLLGACGQKGPLYLAVPPGQAVQPATAAGAAPAVNPDAPPVTVPANPAMPRPVVTPSERVLK